MIAPRRRHTAAVQPRRRSDTRIRRKAPFRVEGRNSAMRDRLVCRSGFANLSDLAGALLPGPISTIRYHIMLSTHLRTAGAGKRYQWPDCKTAKSHLRNFKATPLARSEEHPY